MKNDLHRQKKQLSMWMMVQIKKRRIILQKLCDMILEGAMSLKIDYCKKHCAMLNVKENDEAGIMENIAECMIDLSLKFDEQLKT